MEPPHLLYQQPGGVLSPLLRYGVQEDRNRSIAQLRHEARSNVVGAGCPTGHISATSFET